MTSGYRMNPLETNRPTNWNRGRSVADAGSATPDLDVDGAIDLGVVGATNPFVAVTPNLAVVRTPDSDVVATNDEPPLRRQTNRIDNEQPTANTSTNVRTATR